MCDGLKYLHDSEIMHFDLKPDSILLDEKMVPKIGGYGLSRLMGEQKTMRTMSSVGTMYDSSFLISTQCFIC
jgi:serine/threonine protein kinase